jgi:hypothetical protein
MDRPLRSNHPGHRAGRSQNSPVCRARSIRPAPGADPEQRCGGAQDARKRLAAQIPDSEKIPLCDWVIDNSGELAEVRAKVPVSIRS